MRRAPTRRKAAANPPFVRGALCARATLARLTTALRRFVLMATQQRVADIFADLPILLGKIGVRAAVWTPKTKPAAVGGTL